MARPSEVAYRPARRGIPGRQAGLTLAAIALLVIHTPASAGNDVPRWLREAAARPVSVSLAGASHVVLLDQQDAVVDKSGSLTWSRRYAIRVLTREGRASAVARVDYSADVDRVKHLEAWVIPASGPAREYGSEATADVSQSTYQLYSDTRARAIVASMDADTGSVFGFESVIEAIPPFDQLEWWPRGREPVMVSRLTVTVPAGWTVESITMNHSPLAPTISAGTYSWELDDLPGLDAREPESPPLSSAVARIGLTFRPPGGRLHDGPRVFSSWAEVAAWLGDLQAASAAGSAEVDHRARLLVEGARCERDSIAAIARFVQRVRYAAIELGIWRGGGYQPHAAAEVLSKSYGDCKDKANLMRVMLNAVGISSHLVGVYSSDAGCVHEAWPSPQQFNHCILAAAIHGDMPGAPVTTTAAGERLLIFDPTDVSTPFGELPEDEQQSLALIISPGSGALTRLPETPLEACVTRRSTDVTLARDGSLSVRIHECRRGEAAVAERRALAQYGAGGYPREWIEPWITASVPGASLGAASFRDDSVSGCFERDIAFAANHYAEVMQNHLLVFKPVVVARDNVPRFASERRQQPMVLVTRAWSESVTVHLPDGFAIDELPDPVTLDTGFGSYRFGCVASDGQVVVTRSLRVRGTRLPVDRYPDVRTFFNRVLEAQQAPVVLVSQ